MKTLSEKQINNRLEKYYQEHFGELDTDEWHNNPASNEWKFERDCKVIHLICDANTGKVVEK